MTPPLVGLIGKKRSGKDTFATRLLDHGFVRVAFADPLKAVALAANPWVRIEQDETGPLSEAAGRRIEAGFYRLANLVQAAGVDAVKETRDGRSVYQTTGVGVRSIDPDFWLRAGMAEVEAARYMRGVPVVVTDVRFPNEADAIEEAGGRLVRITRPGLVSTDSHVSETALDDRAVDLHVRNGGTIFDLYAAADDLATLIL